MDFQSLAKRKEEPAQTQGWENGTGLGNIRGAGWLGGKLPRAPLLGPSPWEGPQRKRRCYVGITHQLGLTRGVSKGAAEEILIHVTPAYG